MCVRVLGGAVWDGTLTHAHAHSTVLAVALIRFRPPLVVVALCVPSGEHTD